MKYTIPAFLSAALIATALFTLPPSNRTDAGISEGQAETKVASYQKYKRHKLYLTSYQKYKRHKLYLTSYQKYKRHKLYLS